MKFIDCATFGRIIPVAVWNDFRPISTEPMAMSLYGQNVTVSTWVARWADSSPRHALKNSPNPGARFQNLVRWHNPI
jgi:hypothetical protein